MELSESRENNFGLLRLLLAALVIVSHAPEILDGNRSRELLTRLFGTLSFGELAVDGFFLISGYLITKSYLTSSSEGTYLKKRVLRIYPAFLVSFWIGVFLIGPFAGAPKDFLSAGNLLKQLVASLSLLPPISTGVFPGMHYSQLNLPMWTIGLEFLCYINALCAGILGLYSRRLRPYFLILAAALLAGNALSPKPHEFSFIRFEGIFGTGALYYIYRDRLRFTALGAAFCGSALLAFFFSKRCAEASFAVFGGYLIFWAAFKVPVLKLSRWANRIDLSYGIYLWAWPIASMIAWKFRTIDPWLLAVVTLACSASVAYFSWTFVEKPSLRLLRENRGAQVHIGFGNSISIGERG